MPLIKRYPNRKLYDTEARRYVTLEGVAELVRGGQEVAVVDHATGEDLTAVTLTQILLEEERRRSYLPRAVLAGLVQAGGQTLAGVRRSLHAPLNLARQVDEEIDRRLQALISRGELAAEEGLRLGLKLRGDSPPDPDETHPGETHLRRALEASGLPARDEVRRLIAQLDEILAKLDEVVARPDP